MQELVWLLYLKLALFRANIVGFAQLLTETSSCFKLVLEMPTYIVKVQTHNRNVKAINRKNKVYF